jgi:hypothetical protein
MPNSGYPPANHPFHHYIAVGPASLLELLLPFLVIALFVLLLAAGRRGVDWVKAELSRRKSRAASRAVVKSDRAAAPVLASDLERDKTASLVSQAVGEGRLSLEEGVQRIDAVLRSRHRHELAVHVADLPSAATRASTRPFISTQQRIGFVVAAAVLLSAVLVQALAGLWELWPLAVVGVGATTFARRPSPDVDMDFQLATGHHGIQHPEALDA